MIQVAISADFLTAMTELPRAQQKKLNQFVNKLRNNPTSSALNYEKIKNSGSQYMRSVRVDQSYRCILLAPERGDVYILLYVANHDKAYDWAQRHQCQIHPSTGSLQLFETQKTTIPLEQPVQPVPSNDNATVAAPTETANVTDDSIRLLFADCNEKQLIRLGMPAEFKDIIFGLTSLDGLQRVEVQLPVDAYEALYMVAVGLDYEDVLADYNENIANEVIDVDDYAAAIARSGSQRKFVIVDDEALQKMLDAPLEKWRVFMHPSQRKLVERDWNGPVRVLGGAGTGKTVVAMHRAKWLASRILPLSNKKVLFTTFTKNLAADIEAHLGQICSKAELDRIEVINIDAWVGRFIRRHEHKYQVVFSGDGNAKRQKCWQAAMKNMPTELNFSERFYTEEWMLVVQEQGITSLKEYIKAKRTGRGTRLNRKERIQIWAVFEEYQLQLSHHNLREMTDATKDCLDTIASKKINPMYEAVIVDEGQDMGTHAYKLIRALVEEGNKNDIFVVGDGHQRIYRNKVVLGRCGINIVGRSKKLRINYRTTEETRRMAVSVLEGVSIDDLDDGKDDNKGYVSLMHGVTPKQTVYPSFAEEVDAITQIIESLEADNTKQQDICLVARTNRIRDDYAAALKRVGFDTYEIKTNGVEDRSIDGIRVATMHRVKGLEFQHLFIAGANAEVIPLGKFHSDDPVEKREFELSERALLHVAMTRAIKSLVITSCGKPSPFLFQD
jgi:superfamily I DNA/RNA helicase/mRNA-degrading endonuclease RelE of RelBE toxin-antitoxin system